MNILGLDIGDSRIGIAMAGKGTKIATPLITISNDENLKKKIIGLIGEYQIDTVVVGLPISLDGREGKQAKAVRKFIDDMGLKNIVKTVFFDERFTTKIAESNISPKNRKNMSDTMSATVLLNDYLEKEKDEK